MSKIARVCWLCWLAACGGGDSAGSLKPLADQYAHENLRDAALPESQDPSLPRADADARSASSGDAGAPALDPSLQDLLDWVLTKLNGGGVLSDAEIDRYFSPDFLAQIARATLFDIFTQLASGLPPIRVASEHASLPLQAVAQLDTAMGPWQLTLRESSSEPRQIAGLVVSPGAAIPAPTSYQEALEQLQPLASDTQLLVAEIKDGACETLQSANVATRLAIGSAFKLWVLYALDQKLGSDSGLSWDTTLAIRDELKSIPSGMLQDQPAGTELTLREFASDMISISDNTAADHLIAYVGRSAVEAAQGPTKHGDPAANMPWLKTREMAALKVWASAEQVAAYRAADVAHKRTLLDQIEALPIDLDKLTSWTSPRALDLEWFASPNDLCNALAALGSRAQFDPNSELLQILAINSGIDFDRAQWQYVGYKGGSEPGVLNLSWLLQRVDGRWFSIVITLNDPDHEVDASSAVSIAAGVANLLGAEHD